MDTELGMEEKLLPRIVYPLPAARCPGTTAASLRHGGGCRGAAAAAVEPATRRRLPRHEAVGPAAAITRAKANLTTSLIVEIPETSENPKHYSLFTKSSFLALWCSRSALFTMTPTAEQLSK